MDRMQELQQLNQAFQGLLAAPQEADLQPAHQADDLMVWFLLGGKDVGKSTFLNSLLHTPVSEEPPESAEGTRQFVAYLHESARPDLQARVNGLPIRLRFHTHTSENHRRLCLIDSPDFDSRFEHHAAQVAEVLAAGAADGAILLASPEKYKNLTYWKVFGELSRALSLRHILFVLTKADELGGYLGEVRADFKRTVTQRLRDGAIADVPDRPTSLEGSVFLVDSPGRGLDFPALESRLLRKISSDEVRRAQEENLRRALLDGLTRLRAHYRLEEVGRHLEAAAGTERVDLVFQEFFSEAFAHTVAARFAASRQIMARLREQASLRSRSSLAGMPAIHATLQALAGLNPFARRPPDPGEMDPGRSCDLDRLLSWGETDVGNRVRQAHDELLAGLRLENPRALDPYRGDEFPLRHALSQRLDDLLALPVSRTLSLPIRVLLNLPVYLYFVFFLVLLLSPVLLLVRNALLPEAPDFGRLFTLDRVKVSVIGFTGYYFMAALYVVRKQRDRLRAQMEILSQRFVAELATLLRETLARPLSRFQADFQRLLERLDRLELP